MGRLFKKITTRWRTPDGTVVPPRTDGARKVRERSEKWYGEFRDALNVLRTVPLAKDKAAASSLLHELELRAERARAGRADPFEEHARRPLGEHVEAFSRYLKAKGGVCQHRDETLARVRSVCDGCRFRLLKDLAAGPVSELLARWRRSGRPGGARGPIGSSTSNAYLVAMKGFGNWLARDRRWPENPFAHLSRVRIEADIRRERRTLSLNEFSQLVNVAQCCGDFRGLSGGDRALLYIVAANTGLRANELANLTVAALELDTEPATITVEAAYSKRRRRDVQPIRSDLAQILRPLVEGRAGDARIWPGTWAQRSAAMLRDDPESAGIPYQDDAGRVFDFHSLRHQFVSNLARAGVHPKEAQTLARHSTIQLTLDRYTHLGVLDAAAALDRLPSLPTLGSETERTEQRATGTDAATATTGRTGQSGRSGPPTIRLAPASTSDETDRARNETKPTARGSRQEFVAVPVAGNVAETPVPACPALSPNGQEHDASTETDPTKNPG